MIFFRKPVSTFRDHALMLNSMLRMVRHKYYRSLNRTSCPQGDQTELFRARLQEVKRHEDAVWVEHVVGEGCALSEAMAPIKRARGRKVFPRSSLKAQARHSTCSGSCNDVVQHRTTRSLSAHGLGDMHRLH